MYFTGTLDANPTCFLLYKISDIINPTPVHTDHEGNSKMHKNEIVRKHLKFYGRVQGVGFRYSACYSAMEIGLTGWVRNEWDGSVEMEVQGTEAQIQKLLIMLNQRPFISIENIEEENIPLVKSERKFKERW